MEKYVITTENTADLPYSYYKEHQGEEVMTFGK